MWRGEVLKVLGPMWVMVKIPKLFGADPVGPVQTPIELEVGTAVVVADLNPDIRSRDWWVVGRESTQGSWGVAYPHTHPIGQVEELSSALSLRPTYTDLQQMLGVKAEAAPEWSSLELISGFSGYGGWGGVQYRTTGYGVQLRGRVRLSGANLPMDTVIATVPGLTLPGELNVQVSCMGPAPDYTAVNFQLAIRPDGVLRTRQEWLGEGGVYSFAHTIPA